jgi:peroxiredoxin
VQAAHVRDDLQTGAPFPAFSLPDHTGRELGLDELSRGRPLVLCFVRGWWCPKEQVRVRMLVALQEEITRETASLAVVTVDPPAVNGAFRAGIGASFPFLSDEDRRLAEELELIEITDRKHRPYLPTTFVLDTRHVIHSLWTGFWFAGNPTPEELRQALREVVRAEQPTYEPQRVWSRGGLDPDAGVEGDVIWVREDPDGHEIQRGIWTGDGVPAVGTELGRGVDDRPWAVHEVVSASGRVVLRLRKTGDPSSSPLVQHGITAPRCF